MSKPEDISQEAWDLALCFVEDAQYEPLAVVHVAARAIMAAKAEAYEEAAQVADEATRDAAHNSSAVYSTLQREVAASIAAAIRKLGSK